jgi:DUF2971 family protein
MTEVTEDFVKGVLGLMPIFQPDAYDAMQMGQKGEVQLAYYTSAETAMKIIRGKQLWMRDVRCMNDHSEISASYERVRESESTRRFADAIEKIKPSIAEKIAKTVQALRPSLQEVYVGCLTRHWPDEHKYGRLSMWRAYSGSHAGAALLLRVPFDPNFVRAQNLKIMASPVLYHDQHRFDDHMARLTENVRAHRAQLQAASDFEVLVGAASALLMLSVASKNRGFEEEEEWRLAYVPSLGKSTVLRCEVETIDGIPQRVQKLDLVSRPELALPIDIPHLVEGVIIGPCGYPTVIKDAFAHALKENGIADPEARIEVSQIPLRAKP